MADNKFSCNSSHAGTSGTVCIEANRILDCCRDRDCFENARVMLSDTGNDIINQTTNVRVKDACIAWTYIGIEPIPFNRGFYAIDIKFYVRLVCEACLTPGRAQEFEGLAVLEKKVVLFGSENNVHVFRSNDTSTDFCTQPEACQQSAGVPEATVEVVDPIVLGIRVLETPTECNCCCCNCCSAIPEGINRSLAAPVSEPQDGGRYLAVSIGLFSIIRLTRPAQYLINATEYAVPDKECVATEENDPCSLFRSMSFPTGEFNPPSFPAPGQGISGPTCGCSGNNGTGTAGTGNGNGGRGCGCDRRPGCGN